MANKLEVSFNSPQCGFMSIGFDDGAREFHTTTAHTPHERALPELLQILSALLDGDSEQKQFILHWNREPEEFDFHFALADDNVTLEIYQYPSQKRDPSNRELVFAHTGNVKDVCQTFAETFNQLYADRETDEFEFNWRQPFPEREFAEFKKRYQTEKRELDD